MPRAARALPLVAVAALLAAVAPQAATAENNAVGGYQAIPNGQMYYDTAGNSIQAHGGGITKVGDTFYWWGGDANVHNNEFIGLSMYSSRDMKNWKKLPELLSPTSRDTTGNEKLLSHSKIERPKILYNAKTKKWVLWGHWEMHADYSASEVIVATADTITGPYTITSKGHFRPGAGNNGPDDMGERGGALIKDPYTSAKDPNNTVRPEKPVQADYPPVIDQYKAPSTKDPESLTYTSDSDYGTSQAGNYWTYQLNDIRHDTTLKAVAVRMTPFDRTQYDKYVKDYNVSAADYIVRYPTTTKSTVATAQYHIADPGTAHDALVAPAIRPGLDESSSKSVVYVKSKDVAFLTNATDGAAVYFTIDGSDPSDASNTRRRRFDDGMKIAVGGAAGNRTTVKAVAVKDGRTSPVASVIYQVAADESTVPVFQPVINRPSGTYNTFGYKELRVFEPSYGAEVYYTMDGRKPQPSAKGDNIGYGSRDMTVYQDPKTGTAYLITASDDQYMRVWQLTDDYTDVVPTKEYDIYVGRHREAPALIRNGGAAGTYVYMITSYQSGWQPNQGQYARTTDIGAGFSLPRDQYGFRDGDSVWSALQPFADNTDYNSQPTYIMDVGTVGKPAYVYLGDRQNADIFNRATYMFLPLTIHDNGNNGNGNLQTTFQPSLGVDLKKHRIVPPGDRLLSLHKPVTADPSVPLTDAQKASGTVDHSPEVAVDGQAYDIDMYDGVEQYYQPQSMPFQWMVDLGAAHGLTRVGLSFKTVGGSDAVNRYTIETSNDKVHWTEQVDNTQNNIVGYQSHDLSGTFRYVRVTDFSTYDIAHHKEADWETGLYEVSVYGR